MIDLHRRWSRLVALVAAFALGAIAGGTLLPRGAAIAGPAAFVPGDVNGDERLDLGDPIYLLNHLYASGPAPVGCPGSPCPPPRLIFVVRHAEKEDSGADPGLTDQGKERALRLAETFSLAKVDAIYASELLRTYQTVEPLAQAKGLEIARFNQQTELDALLASVGALPPGAVAVIAGHSYTVDGILEGLGIPNPPSIGSSDYDPLLLVTLPIEPGGASGFAHLRYLYEP
ncbi:MAG: histidine phosphatase family protein [Planctomycetes bacterium]|nr:histidine phosphatase family protein [Planctomycetota bacterium]